MADYEKDYIDRQIKAKYAQRLGIEPEFIGPKKPNTVGQNIMSGLEQALTHLTSGGGAQLQSLLVKNPDIKAQLVRQAQAKMPLDAAAEAEAKRLEMEETKGIGDYLAQQSNFEQQNKILEAQLGARAKEAEADRSARVDEKKQDMINKIMETSQNEKMDTIDKSGLSTDDKLKAKQMILQGLDPQTEKNFWGKVTFGLLGSKEKLKDTLSYGSVDEAENANLPKGTKVRVGNQTYEVQ